MHACIYAFDEMDGLEASQDAGAQLTLQFGVREQPEHDRPVVYIVDEASMIANVATPDGQVARFGSGHLLLDFLEYSRGQRIVFVGDPCQLPPVSADVFSPALSPRYLHEHYHLPVRYAELSVIVRQDAESEILGLAGHFRADILAGRYEKWPKIQPPQGRTAFLYAHEQALVAEYLTYLRQEAYQEAIMIVNANSHCRRLNHKLRMSLRGDKNLEPGELLQVVQNSYLTPLANGDQVLVRRVWPAGRQAGFNFLRVRLRNLHNDEEYETLLIRELLYNDYAGLRPEESRQLLIDFDQRMRSEGISRKSEQYRMAMRTDPYLNALRAKFGYVITCHKAQGGEWPQVFLNLQKSVYVQEGNALYRWFYTALTRASRSLHLNDGFWVRGFERRQPAAVARFFKEKQQQEKRKR